MDAVDFLTDKLVMVILLVAFIPVIIQQTVGANWTVALGGISLDLTIFLFIIIVLVVLGGVKLAKKASVMKR